MPKTTSIESCVFCSELQLEEHVCLTCSMYMSTLRTTHPRRLGSMAMQLYIRVLTMTLESFESKILRKNKCLLLASQDCVIDERRRKVFINTILRTVLFLYFLTQNFYNKSISSPTYCHLFFSLIQVIIIVCFRVWVIVWICCYDLFFFLFCLFIVCQISQTCLRIQWRFLLLRPCNFFPFSDELSL